MSEDTTGDELRQRRIEWYLIVGVIAVPLLLALFAFAQRETASLYYPVMLLLGFFRWTTEQCLNIAIAIWLALRVQILGRRPLIAILLLWTFFVAVYFGCRVNISRLWTQSSIAIADYPWWMDVLSILYWVLPPVALTAFICLGLQGSNWKRVLVVACAYVVAMMVFDFILWQLINAFDGTGFSLNWTTTAYRGISAMLEVLVTITVVIGFRIAGYRFERLGRKQFASTEKTVAV